VGSSLSVTQQAYSASRLWNRKLEITSYQRAFLFLVKTTGTCATRVLIVTIKTPLFSGQVPNKWQWRVTHTHQLLEGKISNSQVGFFFCWGLCYWKGLALRGLCRTSSTLWSTAQHHIRGVTPLSFSVCAEKFQSSIGKHLRFQDEKRRLPPTLKRKDEIKQNVFFVDFVWCVTTYLMQLLQLALLGMKLKKQKKGKGWIPRTTPSIARLSLLYLFATFVGNLISQDGESVKHVGTSSQDPGMLQLCPQPVMGLILTQGWMSISPKTHPSSHRCELSVKLMFNISQLTTMFCVRCSSPEDTSLDFAIAGSIQQLWECEQCSSLNEPAA
jgi:hypothetical protein